MGTLIYSNLNIVITFIVGLFGFFILTMEIRARRKLQKEELEFKKQQFEAEKTFREQQEKWLRNESVKIIHVSDAIAKEVTAKLKDDTEWAADALSKAKINTSAQTLFTVRLDHFRDEKEAIAEHFVPILLKRCKKHIESGRKVYLLIDSGTTLYPFFNRIGMETVRSHMNNEEWINNLFVVTNNLPGISELMKSGLINPNNRYSPLAVNCRILPGVPLPIYAAVTGQETNEALGKLKNEDKDKNIFIGLVTGNWIRMRRTAPLCPIPLARGVGHLDFKQSLIDNSNEIYVVSPLGKVFIGVSNEEANYALGFSEDHSDPDRQPYQEVLIDNEKASSVKLISTSRVVGKVLNQLSSRLSDRLRVGDVNVECIDFWQKLDTPNHILLPFDRLPENRYLQIETEFPHPYTRDPEFLEKFFFIPNNC